MIIYTLKILHYCLEKYTAPVILNTVKNLWCSEASRLPLFRLIHPTNPITQLDQFSRYFVHQ